MNKKSLLLVSVLAVAILAAGFFLVQEKKMAIAPNATSVIPNAQVPSLSTPPQSTKTFEAVKGEDGWVWYSVPELGIEVKVNKDIASELLYKVIKLQSEKDILSAEFTTEKLIEMGERNGIATKNQSDRYNCTLGIFTRYNMSEKEYMAMQEDVYGAGNVTPVNIGGYFIEYKSPQSGCSSGPDGYVKPDVDYEQFVVQNWLKRINGIQEPLTKSVRQIK